MHRLKYIVFGVTLLRLAAVSAQVKQFDKLEMYFSQGHYRTVYHKANLLLDKPEYDYSLLPSYYKSLSLLQLVQNRYWLKSRPWAMEEAKRLFLEVKYAPDGDKLFNAHMYELSWLRSDMQTWVSDLKRTANTDEFKAAHRLYQEIFEGVPNLSVPGEENEGNPVEVSSGARGEIVQVAQNYLGVPYVWAGNTPEGFDCSGFTSFVMKQHGIDIPRRSADQYEQAVKVKDKNVQKGDLIFFNNGSGISHVGIVISDNGQPIVMIHSSSSKGVIITEVEKSEYWMNRLHGYGTYLNADAQ